MREVNPADVQAMADDIRSIRQETLSPLTVRHGSYLAEYLQTLDSLADSIEFDRERPETIYTRLRLRYLVINLRKDKTKALRHLISTRMTVLIPENVAQYN